MKRAAVLILAIGLGGCSPDRAKDMASCQTEAERFYPTYQAVNPDDPSSRYIIGCMATKGYVFTVTPSDCNSNRSLPTQAACYQPHGWAARMFDRFRRAAE
jgi:hypothetical protein